MKHSTHFGLALATVVALAPLGAYAANPPAGYVDFGKFPAAVTGSEFVEVNIKSNLIGMVARLAEKQEPQVAELIRGLQGIHVSVIGLNEENREDVEKRVHSIREQLDAQGWERIVTAQQPKQDVGVFLKMRGEESVEGLTVTVLQGNKQAVLVNIVGDIRPEKIAVIGERFNIEPLKKLGRQLEKAEKQAEDQ